jgi:hypothetical protein
LGLKLRPVLPSWLFDNEDQVQAKFLGNCDVIYNNPNRRNTFGLNSTTIARISLTLRTGQIENIKGDTIHEPMAYLVRNKKVKMIKVFMV